jgi:hypothetical protein
MSVTGSAPMAGPYATLAQADAVFLGNANAGGTLFLPIIAAAYQKAYGNVYSTPGDFYEPTYANGIEKIVPALPGAEDLVASGKIPALQLFSSVPPTAPSGSGLQATLNAITPPNPAFAPFFGTGNLVKNSARLSYVLDALANPDGAVSLIGPTTGLPPLAPLNGLRIAAKTNDLRNWKPTSPVFLCSGKDDPTVFHDVNTGGMQAIWTKAGSPFQLSNPALLSVLDVAAPAAVADDPFTLAVKSGFAGAVASAFTAGGQIAVLSKYHGELVPPFCNAAARAFFSKL